MTCGADSEKGENLESNSFSCNSSICLSSLDTVSLHPFAKIFGPVYGARVAEIIVDLTLTQERLLIEGRIGSAEFDSLTPSELKKLTGIAYLSGGDTWVDGE